MKTPIRTHEGRVALVTDAGQGIGQAIVILRKKIIGFEYTDIIESELKPLL